MSPRCCRPSSGATHAAVRITDADGGVILERDAGGIGSDRFPIVVDGDTVGWVEGDRVARAVAAVIAYAAAREADKRSLAREALDRYRELNLVYELAETLSGLRSVAAIGQASLAEVQRIRGEGKAFLLVADPETGTAVGARRRARRSTRGHRSRRGDRRRPRERRAGDHQRRGRRSPLESG